MKKPFQLLAMLVVVALVAIGACLVTFRFFAPRHSNPVTTHEWIHKQLNLTADQGKTLEPMEEQFHQRTGELLRQIQSANKELAQAIKEDQAYSIRVSAAIEKIHRAQGELQEATLQHVFGIKVVLTADQYQKLLDLTADALNEFSRDE